ncbi:hypothetical protein ACJJTC_008174 [Scirpophaga incertulas]
MDPFTQRMLERARARQEKIDQKLASTGQTVPKRKPLSESQANKASPVKSPNKVVKVTLPSPKKTSYKSDSPPKVVHRRSSAQKDQNTGASPQKRSDSELTSNDIRSSKGSLGRRNSDVALEINIMHENEIHLDVQIEETDNTFEITCDPSIPVCDIIRKKQNSSDTPNISSPIQRTEHKFTCATPPTHEAKQTNKPDGRKKFRCFAALADQINNWEDDMTHHNFHPGSAKTQTNKNAKPQTDNHESSTLDVSVHSLCDINKILQTKIAQQAQMNTPTTRKTAVNECQRLQKEIVAKLETARAPATPSRDPAPAMATVVVGTPANPVVKKPSIKKYRAPTPPSKTVNGDNVEKDNSSEISAGNDLNGNDASGRVQTSPAPAEKPVIEKCSPIVTKSGSKLNGTVDRGSVLLKAAMFEAGSPKPKDPAEMSLRERKALFERKKGAAIIPKAAFGMAPSVKTLHGDSKGKDFLFTINTSFLVDCDFCAFNLIIFYIVLLHDVDMRFFNCVPRNSSRVAYS